MNKFGRGQSISRTEDVRFVTGAGRYVDDIKPNDAYVAHFFRSPIAHGQITLLDVTDARDAEGVVAVYTADDLIAGGVDMAMDASIIQNADGSPAAAPLRPILATERVRYLGEALAVVIAQTKQQAMDASEMIVFDYDELPVHVDVAPGGGILHVEASDNIAFNWAFNDEKTVSNAFDDAAHVCAIRIEDNRIISNSMEPRGCFAEVENDKLHVGFSGQGVWVLKAELAARLGIRKDDIRVTNPDVGGGFGTKAFNYPEYFVVAYAARTIGHAVGWASERGEAMLTDNAGRDLVSDAALAFDENLKIIGYRVDTICNLGAYNSGYAQSIQTELFSKVAPGVYDIPAVHLTCKGVYTNTVPVDAYRGAGRPEAIFVLERCIDHAARTLGVDGFELRRKNFIAPDAFPYTSATGMVYDVGDFGNVLDRAIYEADVTGFPVRKSQSAAHGKMRGLGLAYYIESILGAPTETSRVTFNLDGTASLFVGTQSNGQGHETVFSQYLSDQSGIPVEKINFVQGDSDLIANGGGTGGSRSGTVQNTATLAAVEMMIGKFKAYLADKEGAGDTDVTFDDLQFRIAGSNTAPTMLEVAQMARDDNRDDLLDQSQTISLENRSFPNGAHIAEVEVDADTGVVEVVRYTVVDDFGVLLNPMIVEGQIHGGIAQGLGQAITERVVYDDDGQLLTASFMDYGMPRADNMPFVTFVHEPTLSTYNPIGMKGCGEAGTVGALAAIANAVVDATGQNIDMPFTPERVWEAMRHS